MECARRGPWAIGGRERHHPPDCHKLRGSFVCLFSGPWAVAETPPIGSQVNSRATQRPTHMDFDAVFDAHYADLVRYCRRLTGDEDSAEDAAQESMVRLFGNEVRGNTGDIRAWLFTTATHLTRDRYRVDTNRKKLLEVHPVRPGEWESPDRSLERKEGPGAGASSARCAQAERQGDPGTAVLGIQLPRNRRGHRGRGIIHRHTARTS